MHCKIFLGRTGLPPINRLKESLQRLTRTLIEFELSTGRWVITSLLEKAEYDLEKLFIQNQRFKLTSGSFFAVLDSLW